MSDSLISGQPLYLLYSNRKALRRGAGLDGGFLGHAGHGQREVAGHWQSADHQRFALASAGGATLKREWQAAAAAHLAAILVDLRICARTSDWPVDPGTAD